MKSFEELKQQIADRCKSADACQPEYKKLIASENFEQLFDVLKRNMHWCLYTGKIFTAESLEADFGTEILWANHIYTSGSHNIELQNTAFICALGSSSATVKTLGSSSATVKTWDSSSATVETWGSSSATVKTLGSSSATVETWDSSSATVETWGSSSATVKTWGSSSATVETWGSSSATVKTWDSSSATVETWGSSSKLTYVLGDGTCPTIKDLSAKKLFIKTTDFQIIQQ